MRKTPLAFVVKLAAGITLLTVALEWSPFKILEYVTLDWRYKLRNKFQPAVADRRIAFCAIDDQSLREIGAWPFPRNKHAELLALLSEEKPAVVAWDVLFTAPKKQAPEEDDLFVEKVKLFPHFITGAAEFDTGKGENLQTSARSPDQMGPTRPLAHVTGDLSKIHQCLNASLPFDSYARTHGSPSSSLLQNSLFGFVISDPAYDGVRRSLPMVVGYQNKVYASLSLLTVLEFFHAQDEDVAVNLGKEITIRSPEGKIFRVPIDEHGEMLINYRLNPDQFEYISYYGMLYLLSHKANPIEAQARDPEFDAKLKDLPLLKDNILLLGLTGRGFDRSPTPLEKDSPLVSVHLNAIQNILNQDFLYPVPTAVSLAFIFLFLSLLGAALLRVRVIFITAAGLLGICGYFLFSQGLFQYFHLILPTGLPMLAIMVESLVVTGYLYFGVDKQKEQIKNTMAAYLPDKVMQHVLEHPESLKLGGDKRELSILFCDIRGFTKYCDNRDPHEVVSVLNEYMEIMSGVIFRHEGTIDKYIGDCIMAFWNAPEDQPDHAQRAVRCALEMRHALAYSKTKGANKDLNAFECGIGIHTGPALVGNFGSTRRLSYTTIGSSVNMAARLESLTKSLGSHIIISEATRAQLPNGFTLSDLGEATVSGFAEKIRIYSVKANQGFP